jgi:hypothetical protein
MECKLKLLIQKMSAGFLVYGALVAVSTPASATQVYKCTVNGTVSYQSVPCPSGPPGKRPTLEQLNAAEKLKRERQASESPARVPTSPGQRMPYSSPVVASPSAAPATPAAPAALPAGSFRCDGRTHCSQMNSCAEAKYFLRNCPDVKMDGDLDGIPCEDQWCNGVSR